MKVLENTTSTRCQWCGRPNMECRIVLYDEEKAKLMCESCERSLHDFLEEIGVKEAEI